MEYQAEVSNFLSPLLKGIVLLSDEFKNLEASGLRDYLHSQTEKYYYTNNFLHRSEKVKFRDFYYPISASYRFFKTQFKSPSDVLDEYKKIILVGSAGSGKSTLIQHIFLRAVEENHYIPILIQLRDLNIDNAKFEDLVVEKILSGEAKPNRQILKRSLRKGKFLFLLDGFDEIFSSRKTEIIRQLERFTDTYKDNKFILSTRPGSGIEFFNSFYYFEVMPLEVVEIPTFLAKNIINQERRQRIQAVIFSSANFSYFDYLRNPLLLSMFILAFESHPEIPSKKSAFYSNVFDTLYSKHDGITKLSFQREKRTHLQREDFDKILCLFCYVSLAKGFYKFTKEKLFEFINVIKSNLSFTFDFDALLEDLHVQISILVLDGFEYSFPHRSLQEYFAAKFLSQLPTHKQASVYKKMYRSLSRSSSDNSLNFWFLCEELDEAAFISYFLLPELEKFTQISGTNNHLLIRNFIESLKLKAVFGQQVSPYGGYLNSHSPVYQDVILEIGSCPIHTLLERYVVFDYTRIINFVEVSQASLLLAQDFHIEFVQQKLGNNFLFREGVIPTLAYYKFADLIRELIQQVHESIAFYRSKICQQGTSLDELLDY